MKKMLTIFMLLSLATAFGADDPKKSLELLKSKLTKFGAVKVDGKEKVGDKEVPAVYFGRRKINNNFDVVDEVKKSLGGTATVFIKDGDEFVRVSTNVLKDDGTRAIGTQLARNKAYESVIKGELFCGEVEILGAKYDTCYDPIKDSTGAVIGIYYVGYKK